MAGENQVEKENLMERVSMDTLGLILLGHG